MLFQGSRPGYGIGNIQCSDNQCHSSGCRQIQRSPVGGKGGFELAQASGTGGAVVLVGSQSMFKPSLPQAGYAASKGALLSTMYYLADELGADDGDDCGGCVVAS